MTLKETVHKLEKILAELKTLNLFELPTAVKSIDTAQEKIVLAIQTLEDWSD